MRPISPNTGAPEIVVAEEQEEYLPLSVAFYRFAEGLPLGRLTAWVPKADELHTLACALEAELKDVPIVVSKGHAMRLLGSIFKRHPIYVLQFSQENTPMTPLMVTVGPEPWMLVGDRAPDATPSDSPIPPGA